MARYATHWRWERPTYKVTLGRSHFDPLVFQDWGQAGASAVSNIARQSIRKWLKSHEHLGEYNDRRVPRINPEGLGGQHPFEVVFTFTNPHTAFHFKMRWG